MKVKELMISRRDRWNEKPNSIYGSLTITGSDGEQTINLSNAAIIKLLDAVREEVCISAKMIAKDAPKAFNSTVAELELLNHPLAEIEGGN